MCLTLLFFKYLTSILLDCNSVKCISDKFSAKFKEMTSHLLYLFSYLKVVSLTPKKITKIFEKPPALIDSNCRTIKNSAQKTSKQPSAPNTKLVFSR